MSAFTAFRCIRCGARYRTDLGIDSRGCTACYDEAPANLQLVYGQAELSPITTAPISLERVPSMWRYAAQLPCPASHAVTLGEGLTPLVSAPVIGSLVGVPELYIKDESRNPTWSHKDRFSSVAVSVARQMGARVVATASSGNAGASLAAYATRARLECVVATFTGTTGPMLAQIRKAGATIVPFSTKTDRWEFIAEGVARHGWFATSPFRAPVVGSHPIGIEGYKTLAYEIVEQMRGEVPDWCVMPVCYGDALAGMCYGFQDLLDRNVIARMPRLVAAEVHGSLAAALAGDEDRVHPATPKFESIAISIGAPGSTFQALNALRKSSGLSVPVSNDDLISLQERLAETEGLLAELASITPFAAINSLRKKQVIAANHSVVAIVTASGLKDVDRSIQACADEPGFGSPSQAWDQFSRRRKMARHGSPVAVEPTGE